MRRFHSVLYVIALSMVVLSTGRAQSPPNSITGQVVDTSRNPISNLRVELLNDVYSMLTAQRTDQVGRFRFTGLSQGTFQVRVITSGTNYIEQTQRVELVYSAGNRGAHHEVIEIVMRTRNDDQPRHTGTNTGTNFVQDVPDKARKAFERGVSLLEKQDRVGGINALVEALEIFPDYYLALERVGAEFVQMQDYDRALIALTRAVAINPGGNLSLYALGVTEYNQKKYEEAAEHLRRSYILAPDSANAPLVQFYYGLTLLKLDKVADAETQLKRAKETGGKRIPPDVHLRLAQIYSDSKRYREAADELELFLKEAPNARDAENIRNVIKQLRAKA